MKIIHRGEKPKETREVTCTRCSSVLEYSNGDIKTFDDIRSPQDYYEYILCPVCNCSITVHKIK